MRRAGIQILLLLAQVVLRYLKYPQIFSQVFHSMREFGWQIFLLFKGVQACVQFGKDFSEFDVIEFLYAQQHYIIL